MSVLVRVWMAASLVVGAAATVSAQVGSGQVTGVVTDAAGTAVQGATVTATNVATVVAREALSSSAGVFTIPGLQPGTYRLDVALSGFKPARQDDIRIETGRTLRIDFALAVGEVSEAVTV